MLGIQWSRELATMSAISPAVVSDQESAAVSVDGLPTGGPRIRPMTAVLTDEHMDCLRHSMP